MLGAAAAAVALSARRRPRLRSGGPTQAAAARPTQRRPGLRGGGPALRGGRDYPSGVGVLLGSRFFEPEVPFDFLNRMSAEHGPTPDLG